MIDPDFLRLLVCPTSREPLREATPDELASVNAAVAAGALKNTAGQAVERELESGLVSKSGGTLYPIVDGIPILLSSEAIALSETHSSS
ncbi:MAG: hypothetical protein NXI31_19060 [bacterium]|nr:hypothetical protein [bacterium]